MNSEWAGLARQYEAGLRRHLEVKRTASLGLASRLGRRAMAIGLETLDLARMHEQALITLVLPSYSAETREAMVRGAGVFFAKALTPIEKTHRVAQETNIHVDRLNQTLRQRSADLAASNRELKQEIARRRLVEQSLRKSQQHYSHLLEQSRQMQDQLRLLSRQLLSAQEEERKKISRELHDVIAQTLTSINVRLTALKKEAGMSTQGLEDSIARTQLQVQHSVNIVHRFARELRPTVLDDLGLIPALHAFLKSFTEETGIRVSLSAFAEIERVNGDKRTALFRVAQEALTNIARHARATRAEVKIQKLPEAIQMTIEDNGRGFAPKPPTRASRSRRLGLLGMRERLEMVGGSFTVDSAPGKGTTVYAQIPSVTAHES